MTREQLELIFRQNCLSEMNVFVHDSFKRDYPKLHEAIMKSIQECTQKESIAFANYFSKTYREVTSIKIGKTMFVNCIDNKILIHGSDSHYTDLIEQFGVTLLDVYREFQIELTNTPPK